MKIKISAIVAYLLLLALVVTGCTSSGSTNKLTENDIRAKYPVNEIVKTTPYQTTHILLESQKEGFAPQFDWYDLRTGEFFTLPTTGDFVTLVEIIDADHLVLLSSGRNDLNYFRVFPYLVDCQREGDKFVGTIQPKYFAVSESTEFGSKEGSVLTAVEVTDNEVVLRFGPVPGQETAFFAAAATIPPARTAFENGYNRFIVTFTNTTIDATVPSVLMVDNHYLCSIDSYQKDADIEVVFTLAGRVKYYNCEIKNDPETQLPFAVVRFSESIE